MVIPKDRLEEIKEASFNNFAKYFDNDKEKYLASLEKLPEKDLEKFLLLERFYNFYCLHPSLNPAPGRDFVSGRVPWSRLQVDCYFLLN